MQHREADIRTITKTFRDMEDRRKSFNIHLMRDPEEKKESIEEMQHLKREWLRTDAKN